MNDKAESSRDARTTVASSTAGMTAVPEWFPFNKLTLPPGETVIWHASDSTFHRTSDCGLLITDQAFYLYHPFWLWFARWRRVPLASIEAAVFEDSRWSPKLVVKTARGEVRFRTPHDYEDEMDFDRKNLAEAADRLNQLIFQSDTRGSPST